MIVEPRLRQHVEAHPYPLLFATISGAHLYGFPSPDSDFDLRGVHLLPLEEVVGLSRGNETVEKSGVCDGLEIDLVTHDARKFFSLMLKKNGYVMEQRLSPLIVHTTPEHEELKAIAPGCLTKHHAHHYLGFAATQWKLFQKDRPPRIKPLLYVYRVLLTGIHLMRTGEIEANLPRHDPMLMATRFLVVDTTDPNSEHEAIAWWERLAAEGGEGMVVKPLEFVVRGKKGLVQPAVKCRGREYLRIIYGPDYTDHLPRLRSRNVSGKRSLALREFSLGVEALERFVRREPLRRVHECVFGVLALESEPVDPRL